MVQTPSPSPPAPRRLAGTGISPPSRASGSAGWQAETGHCAGLQVPQCFAKRLRGSGGAFRCLRPQRLPPGSVQRGPLWTWRNRAVSPCAVTASPPNAAAPAPAGPRSPRPRIAFALLRLGGGGKVGGVLERLGAGGRSPGFPGGFWGLPASCVRRGFPRRRGVELPLDGAEWAGRDRVGPRGGNRPKLQIA